MCRNRAGRIVAAAVALPAWPPGLETAAFGPCGRPAQPAQEKNEIGDCPYLFEYVGADAWKGDWEQRARAVEGVTAPAAKDWSKGGKQW